MVPPEGEVGADLGAAVVTVAGSLAISFAVHVGCSVGYWALKRGWAWRKLYVNLVHLSINRRRECLRSKTLLKYYCCILWGAIIEIGTYDCFSVFFFTVYLLARQRFGFLPDEIAPL